MSSRRAAVLVLVALSQVAADFRAVADQARGVVVLEVDLGTATGGGSGFAVGDGTVVVTAHHVVEGARSIRVRSGDESAMGATEVLALDPDHDLALLKVPRPLPVLVVSEGPPPVGSEVLAVGNPQGLGLAFTDGIVSRIHDDFDGVRVVQHSAPISPGNSGGPLLDAEGRVVGVNSFALASEHGQNVNFAIAAGHVRELLADPEAHRPRRTALRPPPPEPRDDRAIRASRRWEPPEGQPRCASPEEPEWPFPEEVRIHELAAVQEDPLGVCRHGHLAGTHLVYARYGGVDARDEGLAAALAQLGAEPIDTGDPCQRAARIPGPAATVDLMTVRNRDLLYVWLRAAEGSGRELCGIASRIRDAAKP